MLCVYVLFSHYSCIVQTNIRTQTRFYVYALVMNAFTDTHTYRHTVKFIGGANPIPPPPSIAAAAAAAIALAAPASNSEFEAVAVTVAFACCANGFSFFAHEGSSQVVSLVTLHVCM